MLKIYNSLSQKKEVFKPLKPGQVKMYVCGPTVYDLGHLGHARSAVAFDIIRKYLIYKGFKVNFVSNYTDIDDKMINRANEQNITVKELADKIIPEYEKDYYALGIQKPDFQPKATEHIPTMIKIIKKLIKHGLAYEISDGVYFNVKQFKKYGQLSKQKLADKKAGARVKIDTDKKNPHDFVLWKKAKPGEPDWPSPWGKGRPGWHIECSAMNLDLLGETIDIHGGGADLKFPHHEDEIAQSEGANQTTFARYWLHNGFVQINQAKMSKSLNNFFTIRDVLKKYPAKVIRFLLISTHYRAPIEFNEKLLIQAKNSLQRIDDFMVNLKNYKNAGQQQHSITALLKKADHDFKKALDDDFEMANALAVIFGLIKETNILMSQQKISVSQAEEINKLLNKFDAVLGIIDESTADISKNIEKLIKLRAQARQNRDFKTADEIRDELKNKGIELEDTAQGTIWKKK